VRLILNSHVSDIRANTVFTFLTFANYFQSSGIIGYEREISEAEK
jgi:hypothetical protein